MPSKLYKLIKAQVGETIGANNKAAKQMLELGRVIKHEARGNEWLTIHLNVSHFNPVLYQLLKPYMAKGSADVVAVLTDPPQRRTVAETSAPAPEAEAEIAEDWVDPDQA